MLKITEMRENFIPLVRESVDLVLTGDNLQNVDLDSEIREIIKDIPGLLLNVFEKSPQKNWEKEIISLLNLMKLGK